jgi:DNA modification methylase
MPGIINETIEQVPIGDLQPHPRNPRRGDVGAIQASIGHHGFYGTVVAQRSTGRILAGNHRWLAAKAAGLTEVPVAWVDVDDEQAERILLVDNRANDLASYDDEALLELLRELQATDDGLAGTGFDDAAMDALLAEAAGRPAAADDAPEPEEQATSVLGDMWVLGRHRLLCGDCCSADDVKRVLGEDLVDCMVTDPPYGVDYSEKTEHLARTVGGRARRQIQNDNIEDYRAFFSGFLSLVPWADYNTAYAFMSGQELHTLRLAWEDAGLKWGDYLVWLKNSPVLSRKDYNSRVEHCLYGWHGRHKFHANGARANVLNYDRPSVSKLHPTMKPVALIQQLVEDGSAPGAVVYEPFCGSGTTLVVCEQTQRRCRAIELAPEYVDVAIKRWQEQTGQEATLDADGRTFSEVAAERR